MGIIKNYILKNKLLTDKRFCEIFILGIISGMPLSLIFSTFSAWLREGNIAIEVITTFAVARMPYSLKFLWAPLVDQCKIPFISHIGHRKSWLIVCSILMGIILYFIGFINLNHNLRNLYYLTIALGVCSATFDINVDAFRIEKFSADLQGQTSAIFVMGYRIGMLIAGAGALYISYALDSWRLTFLILGGLFVLGAFFIYQVKEVEIIRPPLDGLSFSTFDTVLIKPFKDFLVRDGSLLILLVIILFKMGDAMLGVVAMPFYLDMGFTKQQIAVAVKVWGVVALLLGSYAGGILIDRVGAFKGLMITGMVQAVTHFAFIWLLYQGNYYPALFVSITIENLGCGMGGGALIAYLSMLCNKKYSATQYALLSSAGSFFNNSITYYGGSLVKYMGWLNYFIFTVILALPGLLLLLYINKREQKRP